MELEPLMSLNLSSVFSGAEIYFIFKTTALQSGIVLSPPNFSKS